MPKPENSSKWTIGMIAAGGKSDFGVSKKNKRRSSGDRLSFSLPIFSVRYQDGPLIVRIRTVVVRIRSCAEGCRSYRAGRSDRAAYDARRNVGRPKPRPVAVSGTIGVMIGGTVPVMVSVMVHPLSLQLMLC